VKPVEQTKHYETPKFITPKHEKQDYKKRSDPVAEKRQEKQEKKQSDRVVEMAEMTLAEEVAMM